MNKWGVDTMETVCIKGPIKMSEFKVEPCVMALGFFDGVHLGHRELLKEAKKIAQKKNLSLAVMTFYPHPSNIVPSKKKINNYLSPLSVKQQIFKDLGIDKLFIVTFDQEFAKVKPSDFVKKYICNLECRHVVAGFDFTYGFRGQGNMRRIKQDVNGQFDVTTVSKKSFNNEKISSTKIRQLLEEGAVSQIPFYLGDYYCTNGVVDGRNGIPQYKVPLAFNDSLLPCSGTYLVCFFIEKRWFQGIIVLNEKDVCTLSIENPIIGKLKLNSIVQIKWMRKMEALPYVEEIQHNEKSHFVV